MNTILSAAAVSLILWAASFLYFRSYLARRTSSERILSEFRDEVEKLVSEIDSATDRDVQLIEDRMKSLRQLLDEAEKRIGTMRREIDRRAGEERAYSELGRKARPQSLFAADEPIQPVQSADPSAFQAARIVERPAMETQPSSAASSVEAFRREASASAASRSAAAPQTSAAPSAPDPATTAAHAALVSQVPQPAPQRVPAASGEAHEARFIRAQLQVAPKDPPFSERVAELHRAGFSAEIIANRLGKTVGEVDLVIALSDKREERDGDDTGN